MTRIDFVLLEQLIKDADKSVSEISSLTGCSKRTVRSICRDLEIELPTGKREYVTKYDHGKIIELLTTTDLNNRTIAEQVNCPIEIVRNIVRRKNIKRTVSTPRKYNIQLIDELIGQGLTNKEVAAKANASYPSVAMRRMRLKRKSEQS